MVREAAAAAATEALVPGETVGEEITEQSLLIPQDLEPQRLDVYLARLFPERSRSGIQHLIGAGCILINGQPARKSQVLKGGSQIHITWPADIPFTPAREQIDFPIVYEDPQMMAVDKPAGMPVHPGVGNPTGTLVNALLGYDYERFSQLEGEVHRPGIVHRLDKDTSGIMVVAKTNAARTTLSASFRLRQTHKRYLALVVGEPQVPAFRISTLMARHPTHRKKMAVVRENGKEAVTHYRVLASAGGISLLELRIETGRTHQIRVHMANFRNPILGDPLYGARKLEPFEVGRQMLHARELTVPHPVTREPLLLQAELPADFLAAAETAGIPRHCLRT